MILKVTPEGLKNMTVSSYPEMTRFHTSMKLDGSGDGTVSVTFNPNGSDTTAHDPQSLEIPLKPNTADLKPMEVNMHGSPTQAYRMQDSYNDWFSARFGYEVVLSYLGDNKRGVLWSDMLASSPARDNSWLPSILNKKPATVPKITFADCAPYLVVSSTSVADVSSRLPSDTTMDVTKFRPNIVLEGAASPWEEDYWRTLRFGQDGPELNLMHNCVRCKSINIDYATGDFGKGEDKQVLKKLQKDRRVDTGMKWSPVFGRYAFWGRGSRGDAGAAGAPAGQVLKVADEVRVVEVNGERTTWSKTFAFHFL